MSMYRSMWARFSPPLSLVDVEEVVDHGTPRQEARILEHVAEPRGRAVVGGDGDAPGRRRLDPGDDVQEGALPAPRRTRPSRRRSEPLISNVESVECPDGRLMLRGRRELLDDLVRSAGSPLARPSADSGLRFQRVGRASGRASPARSAPRHACTWRSIRSMMPRSIAITTASTTTPQPISPL